MLMSTLVPSLVRRPGGWAMGPATVMGMFPSPPALVRSPMAQRCARMGVATSLPPRGQDRVGRRLG